MGENNTGLQPVGEEIAGEMFCPKCGGKIKGLKQGIKETCPYDDCGLQFSIRTYN